LAVVYFFVVGERDGHEEHRDRSASEVHGVDVCGIDGGCAAADESFNMKWGIADVVYKLDGDGAVVSDLVPSLSWCG
jgi:hypothetical protein